MMKFATSLSSIFLLAATELVSASPFNVTRRDAGSMSNLFPVSGSPRWTTLAGAQGALSLSNTTLRPQKVTNRCPFTYQNSPDGVKSLKAHYPKGSYKPSVDPCGGVSFYAPGPTSVDLTTAKEALFSYSVYFPQGFDFVKGGKLPGLCEHLFTLCYRSGLLIQFQTEVMMLTRPSLALAVATTPLVGLPA